MYVSGFRDIYHKNSSTIKLSNYSMKIYGDSSSSFCFFYWIYVAWPKVPFIGTRYGSFIRPWISLNYLVIHENVRLNFARDFRYDEVSVMIRRSPNVKLYVTSRGKRSRLVSGGRNW